ncbi:sugar transferase [Polaribacter ponticola]|uniref:Sugar transferase n=1 Tax=Polaribacter ponticola TaxID=2978475 RepID=A0ABT5S6C2_9FLAO|nr:sugar transferase [Polaribacter sp. MSW5]MDD7913384.1 sugar transferase [Polaribacter sp. MSW5]
MFKFIFDRLMSLVGLIVLMPFLLIVYLIILIKMPDGSPLFIQKRVGLNGALFKMIKFRTMISIHSGVSISIKGEKRITPFGAVLRKYKIDELPALWNVFKGDMSIVGPRPDVPGYADELKGNDRVILKLRPGITCLASIKYSNEEEILSKQENPVSYNNNVIYPDKIKMNREYYYNKTFLGDLKIIFKTFFRMNDTILKFGYPNLLIKEYKFWTLLLRSEQVTLGALVLIYNKDVESLSEVSKEGFIELKDIVIEVEKKLKEEFTYDKINYLGLMMIDKNVHFHIIPRFSTVMVFESNEFIDYGWPLLPILENKNLIENKTLLKIKSLLNKKFNL